MYFLLSFYQRYKYLHSSSSLVLTNFLPALASQQIPAMGSYQKEIEVKVLAVKNTNNIKSLKKCDKCDKEVYYERFDNHLAKYLTIALLNN